jgi:hypothetical protein
MPKIESWDKLPAPVRLHLIERMRDRTISIADLNQLRLWFESQPKVSPKAAGTGTSAPSSCAAKDRFRRSFCLPARQPRVKRFSGVSFRWSEVPR